MLRVAASAHPETSGESNTTTLAETGETPIAQLLPSTGSFHRPNDAESEELIVVFHSCPESQLLLERSYSFAQRLFGPMGAR